MNDFLRWSAILFGTLGILVCLAASVGVWAYYPTAVQKTESFYSCVDEVLRQAGDRIGKVEESVRIANELTSNYQVELRDWDVAEKGDSRHIGRRSELLSARIHQIKDGLEFAETLIQNARKLAKTFHKSEEDGPMAKLLADLATMRSTVSDLVESAEKLVLPDDDPTIRQWTEEKTEQALSEVVHAITLFEKTDERLKNLGTRIDDLETRFTEIEQKVLLGLWWGRGGAAFLFIWMGIGQCALAGWAWCRRVPTGVFSNSLGSIDAASRWGD